MTTNHNGVYFTTGPRKTALVFGLLSLLTAVGGLAFIIVSNNIIADAGYSIASLLLLLPVILILAAIFGIVAIILAIVTAVKSNRQSKSWVASLVLGIVGVLFMPLLIVLFFIIPGYY